MENSHNGDLDGLWLLSSVDTLATGGHVQVEDRNLTWAFQGHLLEMRALTGERFSYIFRFEHQGDSLFLRQPYLSESGQNDIAVEEINDGLRAFGVNEFGEGYRLITLNNKRLTLRSKELQLSFEKY
jgi:hypothetical protein